MVIGKTGDAGVRLPARSTASEVPTTFHTPSASKGRSQPVAEAEATYEQATSGYPARDAVMVIVEPLVDPGRRIRGVESLVMLSVEEAPVSDEAMRSGSCDRLGGVVSMSTEVDVATDVLPLTNCVDDTVQDPSDMLFNVQLPVVAVAVNVHDVDSVPLVAVTVTRAPMMRLPTEISGVESLV
jgi:hypothetical protein